MSEKLAKFNPFDFVQSKKEVIDLLQEALKGKDPNVFIVALGHVIKSDIGMSAIAEKTGMSRASLYKTINGNTKPKWETVHKILHVLNFNLQIQAA